MQGYKLAACRIGLDTLKMQAHGLGVLLDPWLLMAVQMAASFSGEDQLAMIMNTLLTSWITDVQCEAVFL